MQQQFNRQADLILIGLETTQLSFDQRAKDYVSDLIDWDQADAEMKQAVEPSILQVLLETGADAMAAIGLQPSQWDPYGTGVREFLETRTTKIATDVNDETEKQLRAALISAINDGAGLQQLRALVQSILGIAATQRADLIAQTEVARAQSAADIYAWAQSGIVEGKEWYTAEDERVCKFCGPMNGRVIDLEGNFFTKGDIQTETGKNRKGEESTYSYKHDYDDVPGAPLHPRCRCTLLPVRISN